MIYIRENLKHLFQNEKNIDDFLDIEGEVYRHPVKTRKTSRFQRRDQSFFIKAHWGIGWREILKNLLYFRLPVLGAMNEVRAIRILEKLNIDTMTIIAYGEAGFNPASRKSFLITDELVSTKQLDHWYEKEFLELDTISQIKIKRKLIHKIAGIARTMHEHGMNHRDFYLCHFLAKLPLQAELDSEQIALYLIDLHRAQVRRKTPRRWLIKDLAGLYYSCMELTGSDKKITSRDYLRFIKIYTGKSLRASLGHEPDFWLAVQQRARRLYQNQKNK